MSLTVGAHGSAASASSAALATSAMSTTVGSGVVVGVTFQGTFTSITDSKNNSAPTQIWSELGATQKVRLYYFPFSGNPGIFTPVPATSGGAAATAEVNSLLFNIPVTSSGAPNVQPMVNYTLDGSGNITGSSVPYSGATNHYSMVVLCSINIPVAGQYAIKTGEDDGGFFGWVG